MMTTHFIKLPDGAIINVAHVRRVYKVGDIPGLHIDCGGKGSPHYHDPDGKIYAWFADKAQAIGGSDGNT